MAVTILFFLNEAKKTTLSPSGASKKKLLIYNFLKCKSRVCNVELNKDHT